MCRELAARGVTLLEADTDGVYFAVPEGWSEADERRVVAEVAALLPPLVQLEFEGRYAAMLSHEPKNYALLGYDGSLLLRGVAFRSSRAEPFGEAFLRRAIARLLAGDVGGVRDVYVATLDALRRRELPTYDVSSRVRLTKTPAQYLDSPRHPARAAVRSDAGERPHVVERRRPHPRLSHEVRRRRCDRGVRGRSGRRRESATSRLRCRSLCARAARDVRGPAGTRVHSRRLRGRCSRIPTRCRSSRRQSPRCERS